MPAKARDLFDRIASFKALHAAALKAARAKRSKPGVAAFLANLETEVLRLERELRSGRYRPGPYTKIEIHDPKHRIVSAAPFRDRVVHHAFCAVCGPIFERGFIFDSYANRIGKGTHRAVARYEKHRDRFRYVLRCDIFRYFHAIDHEILKRDLRRRLACERTLELADRIVDGSNPQEPVYQLFPGDDLLTPVERRRGLPIGNLTSQFFSNLYLDCMDHFAKEVLRAKGYVRRFHNRLRGLRDRWRHGSVTEDEVRRRVQSWIAHAEHADTWRLRQTIFRDGWFDPARGPGPPPDAFCAAVLEQQTEEPPLREPQQEHHRQPEQQQRFSCSPHAQRPEPAPSWRRRERSGRPGRVMMRPGRRPSCPGRGRGGGRQRGSLACRPACPARE